MKQKFYVQCGKDNIDVSKILFAHVEALDDYSRYQTENMKNYAGKKGLVVYYPGGNKKIYRHRICGFDIFEKEKEIEKKEIEYEAWIEGVENNKYYVANQDKCKMVTLGEETVNLADIDFPHIGLATEEELEAIEEQVNGDYFVASDDVIVIPEPIYTIPLAFIKYVETIVNEYWYEISSFLPKPHKDFVKSEPSMFTIATIKEDGDAEVSWNYYHKLEGKHVQHAIKIISLKKDLMPAIKAMSDKKCKVKARHHKLEKAKNFAREVINIGLFIQDIVSAHNGSTGRDEAVYLELSHDTQEMKSILSITYNKYEAELVKIDKSKKELEDQATEEAIRKAKRTTFLSMYKGKPVLFIQVKYHQRPIERLYLEDICGFDIYEKEKEINSLLKEYRQESTQSNTIQCDEYTIDISQISSLDCKPSMLCKNRLFQLYVDDNDLRGVLEIQLDDGKTYYFLEGFCGFDIHTKADEIRRKTEIFNKKQRKVKNSHDPGEEKVDYLIKWFVSDKENRAVSIKKDCESEYKFNCILLSNPSLTNEKQEYDHILVSPAGIILIETKNWRGNITITPEGRWKLVGRDGNYYIEENSPTFQLERHETLIKSFCPDVPVFGVICLSNSSANLIGKEHVKKYSVIYIDELMETLTSICSLPKYSDKEIEKIVETIERHKVTKG